MPETLETIAKQITALSESTDRRFDAVDRRFDAVDKRFDAVDKEFDQVSEAFVEQRSTRSSRSTPCGPR